MRYDSDYHRPYRRYRYVERTYAEERQNALPRILTFIVLLLVAVLVTGTAINLLTRHDKPGDTYRHADPAPQRVVNQSRKTEAAVDAFTNLGQIRTLTKAPSDVEPGTLLVVSPWFTYPAGDTALFEELAQKERQAKSLIMNYFARYTKDELLERGEKTVKEDLRGLVNSQLVLGQIRAVYFNEYLFFE